MRGADQPVDENSQSVYHRQKLKNNAYRVLLVDDKGLPFLCLIYIHYACLYVLKFLRVGQNCDMYMFSKTYICVHMFRILNYFSFNTFLIILALPYISSTCSYMTDILMLKVDFAECRKPRYLLSLSFQALY